MPRATPMLEQISARPAETLRQFSPDAIVTALTTGRMNVQGERLSDE